jgi:hypothetical protein
METKNMEHRFDVMATILANAGSRRQALKWVGGLCAGVFGLSALSGKAQAWNQNIQQCIDEVCHFYCERACNNNNNHNHNHNHNNNNHHNNNDEESCEQFCRQFFSHQPQRGNQACFFFRRNNNNGN